MAEWSILWPARAQSEAIVRFLESARRCSEESGWLEQSLAASDGGVNGWTPTRNPFCERVVVRIAGIDLVEPLRWADRSEFNEHWLEAQFRR
jgi:hypothetical protein